MSGNGKINSSTTRAEALTVQSSTAGMTVPWLRGMHRVPGNLLWYGDFRAITRTEKAGGKGGGGKTEKVSYEASLAMAICHGNIHSIPRVWKGKGVSSPAALGLSVFSGALGQAVWSALASKGAQAIGYSGLAYVGAQAYSLGDSASVENHSFEVRHTSAYGVNGAIPDVDPKDFTHELLTNVPHGAGVPASLLGNWTLWSDYCRAADLLMSPLLATQVPAREALQQIAELTNTAIVWSEGLLKMIPYGDQALTANGRTYTPNLTPVYELDDRQLLSDAGDAPVRRRLKTPADRYNQVSVEFRDRAADYAIDVVTAKDLTDISANGLRPLETIQAHWITRGSVARQVAELRKQRTLLVPGTYEVRLPWHYALIECMDLLTLSDATLGLDKVLVRVIEIREDSDEELTLVCEDCPTGIASAPLYPTQPGSGFASDAYAAPPSVSSLQAFELPGPLASGALGLEVAVALRSPGGNWGGATIWISLDGSTYRAIARVEGGARLGQLGAAMSDAATSLQLVSMSEALANASSQDAAALTTLCYVGGASPEYLAYETATLTGAGAYTLGGLVRGAFTGAPFGHASGDPFVRVDDDLPRSGALDASLIGQSLSIKVTSFNVYGAAEQSLAEVSAFSYTVTGAFVLTGGTGSGFNLQSTAQAFTFNGSNAATPAAQTITFKANLGGGAGTVTWEAKRYDATGALIDDITALLGGAGAVRTLAVADFGLAANCVVKATLGADSDQLTIVRLRDGANAITGFLSNEAHSVSTAADGTGGNFAGATGLFRVFNGLQEVTGSPAVTYSVLGSSGVPGGAAVIDSAGNYAVMGMLAGSDVAQVLLRAVYAGVFIDKYFGVSKSKTGAQGPQGAPGITTALGLPLHLWVLNGHSLVSIADGVVGSTVLRLAPLANQYPNQGTFVAIDPSRTYRVRFWARPSAAVDGLLYFSLRQFTDAAGTPGPVNNGRSPYKPAAVTRITHISNFGAGWGQYSFDWTSADWQAGAKFVQPEFLDAFSGSTGHWDIQGFEFLDVTEALAAQSAANTANATLTLIASDNTLHRSEKPQVILEWTVISNEQAGIDARASAYGITTERTAYNTAVSTLGGYLAGLSPLWSDLNSDTPIVGATFRANFSAVYSARQGLLNKIAEVAGQRAAWGGVTGRPTGYRVLSRGLSSTSHPADSGIYAVESGSTLVGPGYMYTVAKINRASGTLSVVGVYNTLTGGASSMAAALNAIGSDHIVVVFGHDEPSGNRLTGGLEAAMYRHGASRAVFGSPRFQYRGAYILVAIGGCGEGNGAEAYAGAVSADTNAWCDMSFQLLNGALLVSGTTSGARALADFGYVQTENIAASAATLVQVGQISGPITVSAQSFVPHNSYSQYNLVGGFVLTPSPDDAGLVDVFVTVTGNYTLPGGGTGNEMMMNLGDASVFVAFNRQGIAYAPGSSTVSGGFTVTRRFSVPGNVSRTLNLYAQVVGAAGTLTEVEGRVEVIKR